MAVKQASKAPLDPITASIKANATPDALAAIATFLVCSWSKPSNPGSKRNDTIIKPAAWFTFEKPNTASVLSYTPEANSEKAPIMEYRQ